MAWHIYNLRPLKIMLAFKTASILDVETAQLFWQCILEPSQEKVLAKLPVICERLLNNCHQLPDARSREILGQGLEWARDNPESIQIHTDRRSARQGHFPNMVAFSNLLDGLERHSKRFKCPVARITHDKQSEFQKTLTAWHAMFSNVSSEEIAWAGEKYSLQRVAGSVFEVKPDEESPGLQITDIILWLYHQLRRKKDLPSGCMAILDYVLKNGWESDFSFEGVERMYMETWRTVIDTPLSPEKEEETRRMLAMSEQSRRQSMERYQRDGLPPFMRPSVKNTLEEEATHSPRIQKV